MTNDKQIDACRAFSCDHELHEDCINAMAAEIDELAEEVHTCQRAASRWKAKYCGRPDRKRVCAECKSAMREDSIGLWETPHSLWP